MATDANSRISNSYSVGLNNVGSYQSAGTPWMSGTVIYANPGLGTVKTFDFPSIAKSITVHITSPLSLLPGAPEFSHNVAVFFGESANEAGGAVQGIDSFAAGTKATWPAQIKQGHIRMLQFPSSSMDMGARAKSVNIGIINGTGTGISGAVTVYAELTNIPNSRMSNTYLSGSGVNTY